MPRLNVYIKKFCISINKRVIDVLKIFEKNRTNLVITIDKNNKFIGIITISDVRKAILNGYSNNSFIKDIVNKNPIILKDKIDENQISNIITSEKFNHIRPPLIPLLNKNNVPYRIVNKNNLALKSLNKKEITLKPRILLLGGAGYIGSILAKKLILMGYTVTVFDKFIYMSKNDLKKFINNKNLELINGDSRNISEIFSVVKKNDIVVHLAELVGDPLCEKQPAKTYEINFLASMAISNICKNLSISKLIYVSSCSVYGTNKKNELLTENSKILPISVYAKLKALIEKTIIRNMDEYCRPCILRLGTVFGSSLRPRYDLVINLFSGLVANNKTLTIQGGDQWRPFIHVEDVADSIIKIIKLNKDKTNGQVFNLASFNCKISDIGKTIKKIFPKVKIKFNKVAKDKRDYRVSSLKAQKAFSFKPKFSLEMGIKELVKFTKNNKIKNLNLKKFQNILNSDSF